MSKTDIQFKTAKLANKKGYNEPNIKKFYNEKFHSKGKFLTDLKKGETRDLRGHYLRPSQSQLQKWLRDKFKIHIEINWNCNLTHKYLVQVHTADAFCEYDKEIEYDTYEEALEIGLVESLKLIK